MSDQIPREPGQDDTALPPELARVERLLLAEGQRWRRMDPPTAGLEAHLRALAQQDGQRNEVHMLADRDTPYQESPTLRTPPSRRPSRWRGPLALVATVLLVAMAASIFALLRLSPSTGANHQNGNATPTPGLVRVTAPLPKDTALPLANDQFLSDISFSSANDGWAVGGAILSPQSGVTATSTQAALVHYHDGVWAPGLNTTTVDAFSTIALSGVSMVSAADGWAVGHVEATQSPTQPADSYTGTVLLHFTGNGLGGVADGHWAVVSAPALAALTPRAIRMFPTGWGYITGGVDAPSSTQSGAVGKRLAMAIYENGVWISDKTPFDYSNSQIVMVSPTEGWAAQVKDQTPPGGVQDQQTTLYHFLNGAWTSVQTFAGAVTSLSAQSPYDVWLLATQCVNCTEPAPLIEQYNGSTWGRIQPPAETSFPQPAFGATSLNAQTLYDGGASGVWLNYVTSDTADANAIYLTSWRYIGTGWALVNAKPASGQLVAITADHNGGVWAITQSASGNPLVTTVLYSQGSGWLVYGKNG